VRILVVSPFLPYPEKSGSRVRTMTLLKSLAGHDVFLAAFREDGEAVSDDVLSGLCREYVVFPKPALSPFAAVLNLVSFTPLLARRFASREARRTIRELVEKRKIDCIIAEALLVGEYARPFRGAYRVLDAHNIEFMRARGRSRTTRHPLKRLAYGLVAARLARYERRILRDFDLVLACSETDRRVFEKVAPGLRVVTVPNTVDIELFRPVLSRPAGRTVVFTGTLWYEPNADAARWLAEKIFPLVLKEAADATLLIVGDDPPAAVRALGRRPGVRVVGPVEDIRPWLERAAAYVAPVRMGSGTRQKLLDAMALGLPVVTTRKGCEGLDVADGEHLLLAETPEEFRDRILDLLRDEVLWTRLGAGGRRLIEEKYSRRAALAAAAALWREVEAEVRAHG
jgi:sugar transferase (PEP-CTERM/EpsH1 system associated)